MRPFHCQQWVDAYPKLSQSTALVHEACIRLIEAPVAQDWRSRKYFFAAGAEAMRRILVENARRKGALK